MDLVHVFAYLGPVGGVVGTSLWDRYWRNRDKRDDHAREMHEVHRRELQNAYAQLITAEARSLNRAEAYAETRRHLTTPAQMTQADDVLHKLVHEINEAIYDRDIKASQTMLLEEDEKFSKLVIDIVTHRLAILQSPDDYDRFHAEDKVQKKRLQALIRALGGRFAPGRWKLTANEPKPEQPTASEVSGPEPKSKGSAETK